MLLKTLLISAFLSVPVIAVEFVDNAPTCTPAGVDVEIFKNGQSPRDFFAQREREPSLGQCRGDLRAARGRYEEHRLEFRRLLQLKKDGQPVTNEAIDERELSLRAARKQVLALESECGLCAVRKRGPLKLRRPPLTHTPIYYLADGSCQIETTDVAELTRAYDRWVSSLHNVDEYPKRLNGFTNVDEFLGVRGNAIDPNLKTFPQDGTKYRAFIAVPGPDVPNPFGSTPEDRIFRTSFSYTFEGSTVKTADTMTLTFATPNPLIQINREVRRVSASGAKSYSTRQNFVVRMRGVAGMWHINHDGYLRYCTVADFNVSMEQAAQMGKEMLLETLYELRERAL